MFSVEGVMGLRSWRYEDGTANLRAVVAANSSTADGVASALKPRRTSVTPYPTAATGGWGFGHFKDGKPAEAAFMKSCFPCHEKANGSDLVFTHYAP